MAESTEVNNNIVNVPDDISTKTPEQDSRVIDFATEEKQFVAKWQFSPDKKETHKVVKTHYAMLRTLKDAYPTPRSTTSYLS